jgi:toluene monooxygenase system ferredoxin subunit
MRRDNMFTKACEVSEIMEGKYDVAAVNRVLILIVWPTGSQPRAFQGMCPHDNEPLADSFFDGKTVTCRHHDWAFNGETGACIKGKPCTLAEYPLKIEGDDILVDTHGVTPNRVA